MADHQNVYENSEQATTSLLTPKKKYEFGGPWGTGAMMIGFPVFMIWLWLSITMNHGQPFVPLSLMQCREGWDYIVENATPSLAAALFYLVYTASTWALNEYLPGPITYGEPYDPEDPNSPRHEYVCNGALAWYISLSSAFILHITGIFDLTWIVDNFGPLMTTGILLSLLGSIALYIWGIYHNDAEEASGNPIYDTFMGIVKHPMIGSVHLKMLYDIRLPWNLVFFVSLSCALKQGRENGGMITASSWFMVLAHFLYANATHKGEEHAVCTWDLTTERFGYMLFFWNAAGIPYGYSATSLYLLKNGPITHPWPYTVFLYVLLLTAYYIWDTSNCQKSVFKAQKAGTWDPNRWRAPPQLPWAILENPKTLEGRLLVDGWWQFARKVTYTSDLTMALSWGLIAGFGSILPYWYFVFFLAVLVHRVTRNEAYCAEKYGDLWQEYLKKVPYCFIPGVI